MVAAAQGQLAKLGIDTANPVTVRYDFLRESLGMHEEFKDGNGLRGTLEHDISRVRAGIQRIGGQISFQPNAVEWAGLLPWILGGTPVDSPTVTYPLADTLTTRNIAIDRNAGNLFTYAGCGVDRATIHASKGELLGLDLDIVAQTETISGSFPAITINTANGPFIVTDCVLGVNSTTVSVENFGLSVDNHIDKERFLNSLTLTNLFKTDRTTSFNTRMPYAAYTALYASFPGGVPLSIVATNGGAVLSITGQVALPRIAPSVPGRSEVMLNLAGNLFLSSGTPSLSISLNAGP